MPDEPRDLQEEVDGQNNEEKESGISTADEALQERIAQLEDTLASKESELGALKEQLAGAVAKYRKAVLATVSGIPEELLKGEAVEEIDASLEQAQRIVSTVRQQLEDDIAARSVPVGAPPRTPVDMSTLSPAAKIAHALTQERS